jgi:hypothetical protein
MPSPAVLINGENPPQLVDAGTTVVVSLANPAGVSSFNVVVLSTDDSAPTVPTITINQSTHQATFTMTGAGTALLMKCIVNNGFDSAGVFHPEYSTTFKVGVVKSNGAEVYALGEVLESGAYGWLPALNGRNGGSGSGGGVAVGNAVPTASNQLTLALEARGNISTISGSVFQWDNQARPGFYWSPSTSAYGNTGLYNPNNSSVGGNPTIDMVQIVDYSQAAYQLTTGTTVTFLSSFVFLSQWTMGAACLFTGTQAFNPSAFYGTPTILCANQGGGGDGPALVCGLSSGMLVFGAWYNDLNNDIQYVAADGVNPAVPHYVVATFLDGTLSIQVDGGTIAITGPNPLMSPSNFSGEIAMSACGTLTSEAAEFIGSMVEIDCWNRALNSTEVGQLNTYYASLI